MSQRTVVWFFPLDCAAELLPLAESLLSKEERERAYRFHLDRHKRRFVVRRAMRRVLLGHLTATRPSEIQLEEIYPKKPRLVSLASPIEFSSSHSGDLGIIVTGQSPAGVDIESRKRRIDYLHLAHRCFTAEEYREIHRLCGNARRLAFFNCWTGKEAYVKALGVGLRKPLRSFAVRCAPDEPPGLKWDSELKTAGAEYRFFRYTDEDHVVTLVLSGAAGPIKPVFRSISLSSLKALRPLGNARAPRWRPCP